MTDFYTKKQGKYWCNYCKIFIEYTHLMIEQHNRSKNHKNNMQREVSFQKRKNMNTNTNFLNQHVNMANNHFPKSAEEMNDNNFYNINEANNPPYKY